MRSCGLYKDNLNNLWEFILKDNDELVYIKTADGGDIGREIKIDDGVADFSYGIDENNRVHLAYITSRGEVKYCTEDKDSWHSKALYFFKPGANIVESVSLMMVGGTVHIFFLFHSAGAWTEGYLLHGVWDGSSEKAHLAGRIGPIPGTRSYYGAEVLGVSGIYVFYLSSGDGQSLNVTCFNGSEWSSPKALYEITGEEIQTNIAQHRGELHVLSLSKEDDVYALEHVLMDTECTVRKINRIYQSRIKLSGPVLLSGGDALWAFWSEDGSILYSIYEGIWTQAQQIGGKRMGPVVLYNYLESSAEGPKKPHMVYGTLPPDINLLLPARGRGAGAKK